MGYMATADMCGHSLEYPSSCCTFFKIVLKVDQLARCSLRYAKLAAVQTVRLFGSMPDLTWGPRSPNQASVLLKYLATIFSNIRFLAYDYSGSDKENCVSSPAACTLRRAPYRVLPSDREYNSLPYSCSHQSVAVNSSKSRKQTGKVLQTQKGSQVEPVSDPVYYMSGFQTTVNQYSYPNMSPAIY